MRIEVQSVQHGGGRTWEISGSSLLPRKRYG
jgi:hypothetical protein